MSGSGNFPSVGGRIDQSGLSQLYATGVSVGNGADQTEDTLQSYTLPAGALANVGDVINIVAGGQFAASTDTKVARVKFGAAALSASGTLVGTTRWTANMYIMKTGASTQALTAFTGTSASGGLLAFAQTASVTDTASISILVTGQNSTASTSGTITCQYLSVSLLKAPA